MSLPFVFIEDLLSRPYDPSLSVRVLGRAHNIRQHGRLCFVDVFQGGMRLCALCPVLL